MNQVEKAELFKSLHVTGNPLVLYNIWDAGGARALADAGSKASATGSWSVAGAHGYKDGQSIPLDFVLRIVQRIAESVDLPLTVDFEGGYSTEPETVAANVNQIIATGAVGINFEDQVVGGEGLHSITDQVDRIKAVRKAAVESGVPLFINARTDLFLKAKSAQHDELCAQAIEREAAYRDAGADGFFIPGLTQHALVERICTQSQLPVNVMMKGALDSVKEAALLGVARTSFGPGPFVTALSDLTSRFNAIE